MLLSSTTVGISKLTVTNASITTLDVIPQTELLDMYRRSHFPTVFVWMCLVWSAFPSHFWKIDSLTGDTVLCMNDHTHLFCRLAQVVAGPRSIYPLPFGAIPGKYLPRGPRRGLLEFSIGLSTQHGYVCRRAVSASTYYLLNPVSSRFYPCDQVVEYPTPLFWKYPIIRKSFGRCPSYIITKRATSILSSGAASRSRRKRQ
jgi:hypothetical protein